MELHCRYAKSLLNKCIKSNKRMIYQSLGQLCLNEPSCLSWAWLTKGNVQKEYRCCIKDHLKIPKPTEAVVSGTRGCGGRL